MMMSDDDIIRAVNLYSAQWIVLTGGEPSLWIDDEFIYTLKRATGKKIAIETNGTRALPEGIDWVTVSPKSGISGLEQDEPLLVQKADEIKVVDVGQDLKDYFDLPFRNVGTLMYLQPCFDTNTEVCETNRLRTMRRVLSDPRWTLSVQMHRFLGIP
jgi:organic radical activating enzyme